MKTLIRTFLLGVIAVGAFTSCESVKFSDPEGVNNTPWAGPEPWEQRGTGGPFGAGGFPQSR